MFSQMWHETVITPAGYPEEVYGRVMETEEDMRKAIGYSDDLFRVNQIPMQNYEFIFCFNNHTQDALK